MTSLALKSSGFINTEIFDKLSFLEGQMERKPYFNFNLMCGRAREGLKVVEWGDVQI